MQTGPKNFRRVKEIAPQSHVTGKFQVDIRMAPLYCFFLADAGRQLCIRPILKTGVDFLQMQSHF